MNYVYIVLRNTNETDGQPLWEFDSVFDNSSVANVRAWKFANKPYNEHGWSQVIQAPVQTKFYGQCVEKET